MYILTDSVQWSPLHHLSRPSLRWICLHLPALLYLRYSKAQVDYYFEDRLKVFLVGRRNVSPMFSSKFNHFFQVRR